MAKVRVYELARELGTTSKKLIEAMKEMDIEVKNHMSTLDREAAGRVIAVLTGRAESEAGAKEKPAAPVEKKKAAPAREEKKSQVKRPEKAAAPRARRKTDTKPPIKKKRRRVSVEGRVTVGEVAALFETTAADLITKLLELGVVANINQAIDPEAIELVADEYNADVEFIADPIEQELLGSEDEGEKKLSERHPVVTVLAMLITAKHHCSMLFVSPMSPPGGGGSPSISRLHGRGIGQKIVSRHTRHEAFTAMRAREPRLPISPSSLSLLTTASSRRPSRRSITPGRRKCPSS